MKYSIKAMYELAKNYNIGSIQIIQIAENQNIPKNYLVQLLNQLKHGGLLKSIRGSGGGYILKKAPRLIHVSEIIEIIDGSINIIDSIDDSGALKNFWSKTEEKIHSLFQITLEDLLNSNLGLNFVI